MFLSGQFVLSDIFLPDSAVVPDVQTALVRSWPAVANGDYKDAGSTCDDLFFP